MERPVAGTLEQAIGELRCGRPVVFPTDTVYGLGVAVLHAASPQVLYDLKRREAGKPIAWLVGGPSALDEYGVGVSREARRLVRAHWPGALTVVVNASEAVPPAFRSAQGTIGLRMPADDTALALIRAVGPLATTSANMSGSADTGHAADLDPRLLEAARVWLEGGGNCASGIASTVVDCTGDVPQVVRAGAVGTA